MKNNLILSGFMAISFIACRTQKEIIPAPPAVSTEVDFELVKPFERSDFKMNIMKITPACPMPGESVQLDLGIVNNGDFPENNLQVMLYDGNQLLKTQKTDIGGKETGVMQFTFLAANREGVRNYHGVAISQNPWSFREGPDNVIDFELFTLNRIEPQADFAVNDIRIIDKPDLVPMIEVEVENHGTGSHSTILEILVNDSELYQKWVRQPYPDDKVKIRIPFCRDKVINTIRAAVNPRYSGTEINTENNIYFRDFRPVVDLVVEELSVNAPKFEQGDARYVTVNFSVRNNGHSAIDSAIITQIKTSLFDDDENKGIFITNEGGLAAGESIYISHVFEDIPDEFYIKVIADANQRILEEDEDNNIATAYYKNPTPNIGRWYSVGPTRILNNELDATGRLCHIAINPKNGKEIYVGAGSSSDGMPGGCGLWKTTKGGSNWFPVSDALDLLLIQALALDPENPSRIIVGTPNSTLDSCILWESKDAGTSWKQLATLATRLYNNSILLIDPHSQYIYLTAERGVFVSDNDGIAWNNNFPVNITVKPVEVIWDLIMDPASSGTVYAAVTDVSGLRVYRNRNYGNSASWIPLTGCGSKTLPTFNQQETPDLGISGSKLFASFMSGNTFFLYSTTNITCQGKQEPEWEKVVEKDLGSKMYLTEIHVDPNDQNNIYAYWAGPSNVWVSYDGGKTINRVTGKSPHVDTHGFAFDPQDPKIIYVLSDGGIFKSTDKGKDGTWSFIGEGIINSEIYFIANSQSDPETIIAGTQDNGNISKLNNSDKWQEIPSAGGDGYFVEINPDNNNEFYTMHQVGSTLKKHSNGSVTVIGCGFNPCAFGNFYFAIVPDEPDRLLLYYNDTLWTAKNPVCSIPGNCDNKITGSIDTWKVLWRAPANAGGITSMAIDEKMDIYYAGTVRGGIFYSVDRGTTFNPTVTPAFTSRVWDITMNPENPEIIYISHNYNGDKNRIHMMRRYTINDQISFSSADITEGLPIDLQAFSLAVDPITQFVLYAGTQRGVYKGQSFDGGKTWIWESYNNGIPKGTHISDLEIYQSTGLLLASTKGRGIYAIRNYADDIVVEVIPSTQNTEPGEVINYVIKVENKGTNVTDFKISISGLENFQTGLAPQTLTIGPGQKVSSSLSVQVPKCFIYENREYFFTVKAQKISNVQEFGQGKAALVVKLPVRQLSPDSYEGNDNPGSAKTISLALNQTEPWNQKASKITGLTIHSSQDADYFKIQFNSNSKAECSSGGSGFGSYTREFTPKYYPGNISITVAEEFCQPMDVSVFSYDPVLPGKIIEWGKYKTTGPIVFECPGDKFPSHDFFVKIWRDERDQVNYSIEVNLKPWVITLTKPRYEIDRMYADFPSWLWYDLPPWMHEWKQECYWNNYEVEMNRFNEKIVQYKNFENRLMDGRLRKFNADLDISTGRYDSGEELLNQCQEIFTGLNAKSSMADVYCSRADLASAKGNYPTACEFLNRALSLHSKIRNHEAVIEDIGQLLKLYERAGGFTQPFDMVLNTYKWAVDNHDSEIQIKSLLLTTESFLQNRDIEGAMSGIVLMEELVVTPEASSYKPEVVKKSDRLKHILGSQAYQKLKTSISQVSDETFEIKTGLLTK